MKTAAGIVGRNEESCPGALPKMKTVAGIAGRNEESCPAYRQAI